MYSCFQPCLFQASQPTLVTSATPPPQSQGQNAAHERKKKELQIRIMKAELELMNLVYTDNVSSVADINQTSTVTRTEGKLYKQSKQTVDCHCRRVARM